MNVKELYEDGNYSYPTDLDDRLWKLLVLDEKLSNDPELGEAVREVLNSLKTQM
jgi:hypothetical protein